MPPALVPFLAIIVLSILTVWCTLIFWGEPTDLQTRWGLRMLFCAGLTTVVAFVGLVVTNVVRF